MTAWGLEPVSRGSAAARYHWTKAQTTVLLALAERELRQIGRRRSLRTSPRDVGLIIAQTVADAVRIDAVRVSLDVTQLCVRDAASEQVMDQLQQRATGHAQTAALVALPEE